MRVDNLLANMGYGSRKEVKVLLKKGSVNVNGEIVKDAKLHIDPNKNTIEVNGEEVVYQKFIYIMMNKPKGVISATEDISERTVIDLLDPAFAVYNPFPVGRLDKDTTGLMLLTNDGKFAHSITSPKKKKNNVIAHYSALCKPNYFNISTMTEPKSTAPFEEFVLDVKVCGVDGRTGKTAVLLLFMERYSEIVFHSMYTQLRSSCTAALAIIISSII